MKKVFTIVLLGLIALLGWQVYRKVTSEVAGPLGRRAQPAVAVELAPVRTASIREVRELTGSLLPRTQFVVAPKVSGRLERLLVHMGDTVENDQLIAVLDSQEYAQQVEQARAELEVAKANVAESESALDVAQSEFERFKTLREKQVASASELDEAEARYKAADARHKVSLAQVRQREAALKAAEIRLSYTQVHVSWENGDGPRVIGERFVDQGSMLRANDPIVSVLDAGTLTGVIHVIERDYPKIRVGQTVVATTDAHPDREFPGNVLRVAPLLQESSRQARVEVAIPNPERLLKPGMFIRARIELDRHDGATVVPYSALVKREEKQGVFVVEGQQPQARFVPVQTGIVAGELAEIVHPQAFQGRVVTLGHHLLEDGSPVILPEGREQPHASTRGAAPTPQAEPASAEGRP